MVPGPVASCHCGAVQLQVAAPPTDLNECQCSICRRYAVRWAYYRPADVVVTAADGASDAYVWGDRELRFHRCATCGCVTHWTSIDPAYDRMGVNARLFDPLDLIGIPVHLSAGPP